MPKGQMAPSWDGEASGAEDSYMIGAGSNSTNNHFGGFSERNDSGNDRATDLVDSTRPA